MNYVCAWCGGNLPYENSDDSQRVSHGICLPCVDAHFPEVAEEFRARIGCGVKVAA